MTGDTIECQNCGHVNPGWAQVCRSCGVVLRPGQVRSTAVGGRFPTDQASLIAIGAGLGSIVLAIVIGLVLSALIPAAPNVAEATPTPTPAESASSTPTDEPTPAGTAGSSAEATPELPGQVTFGFDLNESTHEVVEVSDTFGPGDTFAHSISMPEPFGVDTIFEEVIRVEENGDLTVVQARADGDLTVSPAASVAGFAVPASGLIDGWGVGSYILRDYIGSELVAEGTFTLVAS